MSAPDHSLLLDVNVLLDNYLPNRRHSAEARTLVALALSKGVTLYYAITSLADFFYLVSASLKREVRAEKGVVAEGDARAIQRIAWGVVDNLSNIATAVGADESDRWVAARSSALHADLEDNLAVAAARRAQVEYLVTNDASLIGHAAVPCVSCSTAVAWLEEL